MDENSDFDSDFDPISIPDPSDISALNAAVNKNPELHPYLQAATTWFVELSDTSNAVPNLKDLQFELMKRFFLEATVKLTQFGTSRRGLISVKVAFQLIRQIRFIVCIRGWATGVVERLRQAQQARYTQNDTNSQAKSMPISNQETQGLANSSSETTSLVALTRHPRQQLSVKPFSPTTSHVKLPPELIHSILSIVAAQSDESRPLPAVATYALVNKTWSVSARQLLWKKIDLSDIRLLQPFYYSFAARRYSSLPKSLSSIAGLDVSMQIQKLQIRCDDISGVWELILQRLFLFPNLSTLELAHLTAFSNLQMLFTQTLPSLQNLDIIGSFSDGGREWNWICNPTYDREQARAFFSRLAAIQFLTCDMVLPYSEFLDAAHHNLRSIGFPSQAPDFVVEQFLAGCSAALTVVKISCTALSRETLESGKGSKGEKRKKKSKSPRGEFVNLGKSIPRCKQKEIRRIRPQCSRERQPELLPYFQAAAKWLTGLSETPDPSPHLNDLEFTLMKLFFLEATVRLTRVSGSARRGTIAVDVSSTLIRHIRFIVCIRGWATRLVQRLKQVQEAREKNANETNFQAKSVPIPDRETQGSNSPSGTTSLVAQVSTSSSETQSVVATKHHPRQQHSVKPFSPTVPPEIIYGILSIVAAQSDESRPLPAVATCALVNKTWSVSARQLLWKKIDLSDIRLLQPFYYSFAARRYSSIPTSIPPIAGLDVSLQLQELHIGCDDVSGVWELILQRLFLFPNLRKLNLIHLKALSNLQVLFTQSLPSLQELEIIGSFGISGNLDWACNPTYDREQARAVFSRLTTIEFFNCNMGLPQPAFLDAAHQNLRSIHFPAQTPGTIIEQFFAKCSDALTVVCIDDSVLSRETLEMFAERCPGLRALYLPECNHIDVEGFVALMERRGPELRSLHLCGTVGFDEYAIDIDPRMIRSISTHCRSLEEFSISCFANSLDEECAELLSKRGKTLKQLNLLEVILDYPPATIVECVATNCPNLEVLDLPVSSDLQKPTQEGGVGLRTLATLLQQCKRLRSLGMANEFESTGSESSEEYRQVEAKLRRIAREPTPALPDGFYDWTRYESR
ncbi:hypothetical protein HK102_002966 [Quaeritorhiza haematococci]|nr:hypothetical protein HK102_002966 [Quaeritorhiza haematococci]